MDRDLRVYKDGLLCVELVFNYQTATTGTVKVTVNRIVEVEDGFKSIVPVYLFEEAVHHESPLTSLEEIKAFDGALIEGLPGDDAKLDGNETFLYEPVHYRYVIGEKNVIGIADIKADFLENRKELQFTSARRILEDCPASSNVFETNVEMLKVFCAQRLDYHRTDFKQVGLP